MFLLKVQKPEAHVLLLKNGQTLYCPRGIAHKGYLLPQGQGFRFFHGVTVAWHVSIRSFLLATATFMLDVYDVYHYFGESAVQNWSTFLWFDSNGLVNNAEPK